MGCSNCFIAHTLYPRYGPEYTGIDNFVGVHANQATGEIGCDHWHEGSGFLTHHLALSSSLEMALSAVDKSVAMPYWDFTIEGEKLKKAGVGPAKLHTVTEVFTDTWCEFASGLVQDFHVVFASHRP